MKTRKSLAQKITEISKIGTLRTFTIEEAFKFLNEYKDCYSMEDLKERYSKGIVLCRFDAFDKDSDFVSVAQLNNFATFITDIVYIMINE